MSYRRVRAMCVKELHHITRDSRSLAMALGIPVLMLLLFGFAVSLDVDRIPTLIYDQDQTSESRALIRRFEGSLTDAVRRQAQNDTRAALSRALRDYAVDIVRLE